jgi:hypothetical protein
MSAVAPDTHSGAHPAAAVSDPYGHRRGSRGRRSAVGPERSPFVPLLIVVLAMLASSAFQLVQLLGEANVLATSRETQQKQYEQAQRVREGLDALATETRKLAEGGNANAKLILEELRKRGVTISAPAQK